MDFKKNSTIIFDSVNAVNKMRSNGYAGVNRHSSVRYLVDGIKDTSLDATKNCINADQTLRGDFNRCVQLFQDFITQRKSQEKTSNLNISQSKSRGGDKGEEKKRCFNGGHKAGKKGQTGVEFRYYKMAEYNKLKPEQKDELRQWRSSRGSNDKDSEIGPPPSKKQCISEVTSTVVETLKQMNISSATTNSNDAGNTDNDAAQNNKSGDGNNSNNPALHRGSATRQTGGRV